MSIVVEDLEDGVTRVVLAGRIDHVGAGEIDLRFSVVAGARRAVVVDLAAVTYLASLGIRTLLTGAKAVERKGGHMVLLAPVPHVEEVLKLTGIDQVIPIHHDPAAAVAAVAGRRSS